MTPQAPQLPPLGQELEAVGQGLAADAGLVDYIYHFAVGSPWAAVAAFALFLAWRHGVPWLKRRRADEKTQERKDEEQDNRMSTMQRRQDKVESDLESHEEKCEARHRRIDKRLETIEGDNKQLIAESSEIKGKLDLLIQHSKP